MKRRYEALLVGKLEEPETVREPIGGKEAITDFAPLRRRGPLTWVSAELHTGRTHQVRIHATARGTPIIGDSKYGRALSRDLSVRPPRLALHAVELSFTDPSEEKILRFASPLPGDLQTYWDALPDPDPSC
jgi:23S rRNA-/tRNA-specific pseudouridylate synthase